MPGGLGTDHPTALADWAANRRMPKLKVLVSLITEDNDYQREQAAVAETTAQKLEIDADIQYANNDGVTQCLQIVKVIQGPAERRPQAIVVESVGTPMAQVAHAAAVANIGWVMMNRSVDYVATLRALTAAPIFCVSSDNEEVGRLQGKQFNALISKGLSVLYITGPTTSGTARQRMSGMLATKRPDIDVKTLKGDWTEASAYRSVGSWLKLTTSKNLHIGLIGCQNDAMAMGARKAIEDIANAQERDALLKLPFTGCDGIPAKGQKFVQMRLLRATVVNSALTGIALEMLARALRSRTQPAEQTLIPPASYPALAELKTPG